MDNIISSGKNESNIDIRSDTLSYDAYTSKDVCIFCGTQHNTINFKNKCICTDCLDFVKEMI